MIDDYEDDELAETGKVEASDDEALDDFEPYKAPPKSVGVKILIGCLIAFVCITILAGITAALVVPTFLRGRDKAWEIQCTNNLKQIYPAAAAYAEGHSDTKYWFPRDKSGDPPLAHDSLNILLKSRHGRNLEPRLFKCPAGPASLAHVDADAKFTLDEDTNDYAWCIVKRSLAGKAEPLAACKHHEGVLIVLYTDSTVRVWDFLDPDLENILDEETGLPIGLGR